MNSNEIVPDLSIIARRLEIMHDGQRSIQEKLNRLALAIDAIKAEQQALRRSLTEVLFDSSDQP